MLIAIFIFVRDLSSQVAKNRLQKWALRFLKMHTEPNVQFNGIFNCISNFVNPKAGKFIDEQSHYNSIAALHGIYHYRLRKNLQRRRV
ncbi:hypothetical protein [Bartonella tribocorum]|uniref:hypothetical protein n=1 Tax=Bartonella tribocorum TaxID=85701 RepID=UPI001AED08DD|nr:hypothetical protein [Bartonella tribocorum]